MLYLFITWLVSLPLKQIYVFNIFKDFLSNRQQHVLVDGNFSQFKLAASGVSKGSVLGLLLFILYTADM